MEKVYDDIIVGGGCAGLQLATALRNSSEAGAELLIIDQSRSIPDRTWCLWSKGTHAYDHLVSKRWKKLRFRGPREEITFDLGEWEYQFIAGQDFFNAQLTHLAEDPGVEIRTASVQNLQEKDSVVVLETESGKIQGKTVYNSQPDRKVAEQARFFTWQHFKGWFIKTDEPVFDAETPTLMDFSLGDRKGATHFMYTLPFSSQTALVEYTVFSPQPDEDEVYDSAIKNYLNREYPGLQYQIMRTESGMIPMTDFNFSQGAGNRMLNIGGRAGMVKPTTGYAFSRIMKDTDLMVRENKRFQSPSRFRLYDNLLLRIITERPEAFPMIMEKLFLSQPISRIFRFLDETTHPIEEALIFSRLPIGMFLNSLKDELFGRN